MKWNVEDTALLKQCIAAKMSATQASEKLGERYSRCACLCKAAREGWKFQAGTRANRTKSQYGKKVIQPVVLPTQETPPEDSETACTFEELEEGRCRWPLWTSKTAPADYRYCGAFTSSRPYCLNHFLRAYPRRSRRELIAVFFTKKVPVKA